MSDNTITRFRGDTYPLIVTLSENGVPVDLTAVISVKLTISLDTPVTILGTVTDAPNGEVTFAFDQTAIGVAGIFEYDIQAEDASYVTTYVRETFRLLEDLTA